MKSRKGATLHEFIDDCITFIDNTDENKILIDTVYLRIAEFVEKELITMALRINPIADKMDYCNSIEVEATYVMDGKLKITIIASASKKLKNTFRWESSFAADWGANEIDFGYTHIDKQRINLLKKVLLTDLKQMRFESAQLWTGFRKTINPGFWRRKMNYSSMVEFLIKENIERNTRRVLLECMPEPEPEAPENEEDYDYEA